jgi:hypothetical protein
VESISGFRNPQSCKQTKTRRLLRQRQTFLLLDLHSKRSVAAPALRFIDTPVEVPVFHSVTEAKNYLAHIPLLLGKGELDFLRPPLNFPRSTKNWLDADLRSPRVRVKSRGSGRPCRFRTTNFNVGLFS